MNKTSWTLLVLVLALAVANIARLMTPDDHIDVRIEQDLREFAKLTFTEPEQPQLTRSMAVVDSTGELVGGPVVLLAPRKLSLVHVSWFSQVYVDTAQVTSEYENMREDPVMMSESPGTDTALARVPLYMADDLWQFLVDYQ